MSDKDLSTEPSQNRYPRQPSPEAIEILSRMMAKRLVRLRDSKACEASLNMTSRPPTTMKIADAVQIDWIEQV
jgi:hypothetical protein